MSEKQNHYYISCVSPASGATEALEDKSNWKVTTARALFILGTIADRLADLVLAVEEQTQAIISPDRPGLKF